MCTRCDHLQIEWMTQRVRASTRLIFQLSTIWPWPWCTSSNFCRNNSPLPVGSIIQWYCVRMHLLHITFKCYTKTMYGHNLIIGREMFILWCFTGSLVLHAMDRHTSRHCYFRCLCQKLNFTRPSFCNLDPPQLSETNKLEGWHQLRSKHLRGNKLSLMGLGRGGVSHWKCVSRALRLQLTTEKGLGQWAVGNGTVVSHPNCGST